MLTNNLAQQIINYFTEKIPFKLEYTDPTTTTVVYNFFFVFWYMKEKCCKRAKENFYRYIWKSTLEHELLTKHSKRRFIKHKNKVSEYLTRTMTMLTEAKKKKWKKKILESKSVLIFGSQIQNKFHLLNEHCLWVTGISN